MQFDLSSAEKLVSTIPHWHHKFEIYPGVVTPGSYDPEFLWEKLRLEGRCEGRRVLDIGASDGFFVRKLDQLGSHVVAVDYREKEAHGFGVMERLCGREFHYENANVVDLQASKLGRFDVVLFLGVLYHLPDMMRVFRTLRRLCRGTLFVESHCDASLPEDVAAARYYRASTLANDHTNFWSPNLRCVLDMLDDAAFDVVRSETWGDRLFVEASVADDPARLWKLDLAYGAG